MIPERTLKDKIKKIKLCSVVARKRSLARGYTGDVKMFLRIIERLAREASRIVERKNGHRTNLQ